MHVFMRANKKKILLHTCWIVPFQVSKNASTLHNVESLKYYERITCCVYLMMKFLSYLLSKD